MSIFLLVSFDDYQKGCCFATSCLNVLRLFCDPWNNSIFSNPMILCQNTMTIERDLWKCTAVICQRWYTLPVDLFCLPMSNCNAQSPSTSKLEVISVVFIFCFSPVLCTKLIDFLWSRYLFWMSALISFKKKWKRKWILDLVIKFSANYFSYITQACLFASPVLYFRFMVVKTGMVKTDHLCC